MSMIGNLAELTAEQLASLEDGSVSVAAFLDEGAAGGPLRSEDFDKAWHGIHYLLTGKAWGGDGPLARALMGGTQLGEEDVGYGPATYLTAEEVAEVSRALEKISVDELHRRYDPAKMEKAEIYPSGIWEDEGEEAFDYLKPYFEQLVAFYKECAKNGNPLLQFLN